jgi:hypothetical protein
LFQKSFCSDFHCEYFEHCEVFEVLCFSFNELAEDEVWPTLMVETSSMDGALMEEAWLLMVKEVEGIVVTWCRFCSCRCELSLRSD